MMVGFAHSPATPSFPGCRGSTPTFCQSSSLSESLKSERHRAPQQTAQLPRGRGLGPKQADPPVRARVPPSLGNRRQLWSQPAGSVLSGQALRPRGTRR